MGAGRSNTPIQIVTRYISKIRECIRNATRYNLNVIYDNLNVIYDNQSCKHHNLIVMGHIGKMNDRIGIVKLSNRHVVNVD